MIIIEILFVTETLFLLKLTKNCNSNQFMKGYQSYLVMFLKNLFLCFYAILLFITLVHIKYPDKAYLDTDYF